jgi:large subunit ribosomal protein L25
VDFLRVDLSKPIEAVVTIELVGSENAPGIRDGGVLDQSLREVTVEALPNEIPEMLTVDVSEMNIGDTLPLSAVVIPSGVTLLDDAETVAVSLLAPRLRTDEEEEGIEEETELVGEGDASADAGESGGDED